MKHLNSEHVCLQNLFDATAGVYSDATLTQKPDRQRDAVSILIQSQCQTANHKRGEITALKWPPVLRELQLYLNVKLQIAFIHLFGDHAFNDLHGNLLEAVVSRAEDVVCFSFLDL